MFTGFEERRSEISLTPTTHEPDSLNIMNPDNSNLSSAIIRNLDNIENMKQHNALLSQNHDSIQ